MNARLQAIEEAPGVSPEQAFADAESRDRPVIYRGLVKHWPLVQKSRASRAETVAYLRSFDRDRPVTAFVGEPGIRGRLHYTDGLEDTNFEQIETRLSWVLDRLEEHADAEQPPTIYMGSSTIDQCLPGLGVHNSLPQGSARPSVRIWLGNRTRVAAHFDVLDNIACVCAGRRRFTLFPPEQLPNLYVGPMELTPAGQQISLVDLDEPDLERFPRFKEALDHALQAHLEPGDAIYVPSMWWHHVAGLEGFNILINHWWRNSSAWMGPPGDALLHAILNIRELSPAERAAWRVQFEHYVFSDQDETVAHIPAPRRGVLGPLDENMARRLRSLLRNKLNR